MTDPSSPDLKTLWKAQQTETDPMTLEQIHALVGKYDRKMRRTAVAFGVILSVAGALGTVQWMTHSDLLGRTGAVLYVLGMLGACALLARYNFPRRDPAEPASSYLRRRLERQLANLRGGWAVALLPLVPFMIEIVVWMALRGHATSRGPAWTRYLPLAVLAAVWVVVMLLQIRRQTPRIKADLDELDRLMN